MAAPLGMSHRDRTRKAVQCSLPSLQEGKKREKEKGSLVVGTTVLPMQGEQVISLVGELRSRLPWSKKKKGKEKFMEDTPTPLPLATYHPQPLVPSACGCIQPGTHSWMTWGLHRQGISTVC